MTAIRYQPADQMQDGILMHGILDMTTNTIHGEFWAFAPHRNAAMDYLNNSADSAALTEEDGDIFERLQAGNATMFSWLLQRSHIADLRDADLMSTYEENNDRMTPRPGQRPLRADYVRDAQIRRAFPEYVPGTLPDDLAIDLGFTPDWEA